MTKRYLGVDMEVSGSKIKINDVARSRREVQMLIDYLRDALEMTRGQQ